MYTHLINFIAVVLLYELFTPPAEPVDLEWGKTLLSTALTVVLFFILVRMGFAKWVQRLDQGALDSRVLPLLRGSLVQRYVMVAVGAYALILYVFKWKTLCVVFLGAGSPQFLQGFFGILPFLLLLLATWAGSYPYAVGDLSSDRSFLGYLASHAKLYLIVLVPWLAIMFLWDILSLFSADMVRHIQENLLWSLGTFVLFLFLLAWVFPVMVVRLWRCPRLPSGPQREKLEDFFARHDFHYADMVIWNLFEGSFSTAGIFGLFPKSRYILITPSLLATLSEPELEAVMAHEMGHARHRHMLFYLIFIVGLTLVFDLSLEGTMWAVTLGAMALEAGGSSMEWLGQPETASTVISVIVTAPALILVVLYFRYGFGVFARNFERQSDLQALEIQKTSEHIVRSLDKISGFSHTIRMLPNWHHFSIQERTNFLRACEQRPEMIASHHKKVRTLVRGYLVAVLILAAVLMGWKTQQWGKGLQLVLLQRIAENRLEASPEDPSLWFALGNIAFERGDFGLAEATLQRSLQLEPENPEALNNLAWLYATAEDQDFKRPQEALRLAKQAVELQPNAAHIMDTLAEAYFINGMPRKALEVEEKALSLTRDRRGYYERQIKRFRIELDST